MWRPTVRCPACGAVLPNRAYRIGGLWRCENCQGEFQIAQWILLVTLACAVGLSAGICALVGLRGFWLAGATVLLWFPVDFALVYLRNRIISIPLEAYSGKEGR